MKIKTVLVAGLAGGIGYVLGARAGESRYEEIKSRADRLAHSPQVQETVTNLAEGVKKNAAKLPDPVADVVTKVADTVTSSTDAEPGTGAGAGLADADLGSSGSSSSSSSSSSSASGVGAVGLGTAGLGAADLGTSDLGTSDLGTTSDLGATSDFGTSDLGTSDLGAVNPEVTDLDNPDLDTELTEDLGPDLGGEDPTPRRAE